MNVKARVILLLLIFLTSYQSLYIHSAIVWSAPQTLFIYFTAYILYSKCYLTRCCPSGLIHGPHSTVLLRAQYSEVDPSPPLVLCTGSAGHLISMIYSSVLLSAYFLIFSSFSSAFAGSGSSGLQLLLVLKTLALQFQLFALCRFLSLSFIVVKKTRIIPKT